MHRFRSIILRASGGAVRQGSLRPNQPIGIPWGEKDQTTVVKKIGKRFGCNMISAITNQGDLRFMVFGQRFTVKVFLEFLGRLVRSEAGRKVCGHSSSLPFTLPFQWLQFPSGTSLFSLLSFTGTLLLDCIFYYSFFFALHLAFINKIRLQMWWQFRFLNSPSLDMFNKIVNFRLIFGFKNKNHIE